MITKMTGKLTRVLDEEARLEIGAFEYQVLVPEYVRRIVQTRVGEVLSFHISEYIEGNQVGSKMIPRRIGFLSESELEFFDLFCTVDKIGVRKALKALGRPVKEIAEAIARSDAKWLTTLAGIGKTSAEQIIATLKTKVTKYTLASDGPRSPDDPELEPAIDPKIVDDAYAALLNFGMSASDARSRIDAVLRSGVKIASVQDYINAAFRTKKGE